MSPVLDLLQFTHSLKAAFAIWCFDSTTEFQQRMQQQAEYWSALHTNFIIYSRCFSSVQLKFLQCLA